MYACCANAAVESEGFPAGTSSSPWPRLHRVQRETSRCRSATALIPAFASWEHQYSLSISTRQVRKPTDSPCFQGDPVGHDFRYAGSARAGGEAFRSVVGGGFISPNGSSLSVAGEYALPPDALGMTDGRSKSVTLRVGLDEAQRVKTLAHDSGMYMCTPPA